MNILLLSNPDMLPLFEEAFADVIEKGGEILFVADEPSALEILKKEQFSLIFAENQLFTDKEWPKECPLILLGESPTIAHPSVAKPFTASALRNEAAKHVDLGALPERHDLPM